MNITLSTKDADFIIRFLRKDLEKVSNAENSLKERQTEFKNRIDELNVSESCPEMILVNGLLDVSNNLIEESEQTKNELCKCIELLTAGSEDLNGAA